MNFLSVHLDEVRGQMLYCLDLNFEGVVSGPRCCDARARLKYVDVIPFGATDLPLRMLLVPGILRSIVTSSAPAILSPSCRLSP
jgi:hypothetical protein